MPLYTPVHVLRTLCGALLAALAMTGCVDAQRGRITAPTRFLDTDLTRSLRAQGSTSGLFSETTENGPIRPFKIATFGGVTTRSADIQAFVLNELIPTAAAVIARSVQV